LFVNVRDSACGGYPVVNGADGLFFDSYQRLGGKPKLGRPLSVTWEGGRMARQAFDTVILAAPLDILPRTAPRPIKLVLILARDHPSALMAHGLPVPESVQALSDPQALLSDLVILRAYLRTPNPEAARPPAWASARQRWGDPLGPPEVMADGWVRQPFERAVFERGSKGPARLASLGRAAVTAGLVPDHARRLSPVPNLEVPAIVRRPSHVGPFVKLFASGLGLWMVLVGLFAAIARSRRAVSQAVPAGQGPSPVRHPVGVGASASEVET
jgi:hypothetical protein